MFTEKIINVVTGEEIYRNYTSEEIAEVEKARADAALLIAEQKTIYAKKEEILTKLGLTSEEAAVLLG